MMEPVFTFGQRWRQFLGASEKSRLGLPLLF